MSTEAEKLLKEIVENFNGGRRPRFVPSADAHPAYITPNAAMVDGLLILKAMELLGEPTNDSGGE